jgi:3alpha(or 20beta)-hydroxysteroid dehydrogenase
VGSLAGHVVIVTGAARGIGAAVAAQIVAEGGYAVLTDVKDDEGAVVAAEIGDRACYRHLDVTNPAQWQSVVTGIVAGHGRLDGLVNNAAISSVTGGPCDFATVSLDEVRTVLEINVMGMIAGIQTVVPHMIRARSGSIVNFSSTGGFRAVGGFGPYATSKFAVRGLTKAFAAELGVWDVRVNSVHPGHVLTPMRRIAIARESTISRITSTKPLGRDGQPEEVARLTTFLLSPLSSYCTGSEFLADGGLLAGTRPTPVDDVGEA